MELRISNELETKTTNHGVESNDNNFTILINLTPDVYHAFSIDDFLFNVYDSLNLNYVTSDQQLSYWDRCMIPYHDSLLNKDDGCTFNQYLDKFKSYSKDILCETAPSYLYYYHSSYLLSHYAKLHPIYFYISLRNPIHNTWSSYWYPAETNSTIINKISNDLDTFPHLYPKYQILLDYIQTNGNISHNNSDIDEDKVIDLWIDASYDLFNNLDYNLLRTKQGIHDMMKRKHSAFNIPIFARCCYYPQLLMWFHTFNNNTVKLSDKLKIFQWESMLNDKDSFSIKQLLKQVFLWIDIDAKLQNDAHVLYRNNSKYHDVLQEVHAFPQDITLKNKLHALYKDCNVRLYWFLQQNTELLLLANDSFNF